MSGDMGAFFLSGVFNRAVCQSRSAGVQKPVADGCFGGVRGVLRAGVFQYQHTHREPDAVGAGGDNFTVESTGYSRKFPKQVQQWSLHLRLVW